MASDPNNSIRCRRNGANIAGCKAVFGMRFVTKILDRVTVKTIQPVTGAHPDETLIVLIDIIDEIR